LQRRLNSLGQKGFELRETNVPAVVELLSERYLPGSGAAAGGLPPAAAFRSFEHGLGFRQQMVDAFLECGFLIAPEGTDGANLDAAADVVESLSASVEVFQALVTAIVAVLHSGHLTFPPVAGFEQAGGGWVHLPDFGKF
jgi:hypothetical protein